MNILDRVCARYERSVLCYAVPHLSVVVPSSVFRQCSIFVIDLTTLWVEDHILQHRTKLDCVENVRLLLSGQANAFSVAL